jgi:hypothetical protein
MDASYIRSPAPAYDAPFDLPPSYEELERAELNKPVYLRDLEKDLSWHGYVRLWYYFPNHELYRALTYATCIPANYIIWYHVIPELFYVDVIWYMIWILMGILFNLSLMIDVYWRNWPYTILYHTVVLFADSQGSSRTNYRTRTTTPSTTTRTATGYGSTRTR